jgi:hypothetical protein
VAPVRAAPALTACLLGCLLVQQTAIAGPAPRPIEILEVFSPSFGTWLAGPSGRQLVLFTDDTVGGANAADYLFGARSGEFVISGSANQAINILVDNTFATGGIVVNQVICQYHRDLPARCDGAGVDARSGNNRTLKIGIDITTSQAHTGGDAPTINMDVAIIYL